MVGSGSKHEVQLSNTVGVEGKNKIYGIPAHHVGGHS